MNKTTIKCPGCGCVIPVTEALESQIRAELESHLRESHGEAIRRAAAKAEARTREAVALEQQDLARRLAEQQAQLRTAQENELALRRRTDELEERARSLDLEVARRVDEERRKLEQSVRGTLAKEQALKLREKDQRIEDLTRSLEEAHRRVSQGSQERQGRALENGLQVALAQHFPRDHFRSVAKGVRGADLIQEVCNAGLQPCGTILWEMKNTKRWSPGWIPKLKDDQRAAGAGVAVIVSVALPDDLHGFGHVDGVWVTDLVVWPALALVLREQLIQVAFARKTSVAMAENMEALYRYLSGEAFRHRVQALVETMQQMQAQLDRERRAMERLWRERAGQIERIVMNTAGLYGEMRGLIGTTLPEIPALALDPLVLPGDNGPV